MRKIEAEFRAVTPMFCGGADSSNSAELRPPSFKGALRFWWRALMWHQVRDVEQLWEREARLFGTSDQAIGQSKVLLSLEPPSGVQVIAKGDKLKYATGTVVGPGGRYLGYGVMGAFGATGGVLTRPCLAGGFSFTVKLAFKPSCSDADVTSVENALKVLGLVGGIGGKSRKGYGSVSLVSLSEGGEERWSAPTSADAYREQLQSLIPRTKQGEPPYTAFSVATKIQVVQADTSDPLVFLDHLGRELVRYRSWGHNGKILGDIDREEKFKDDHDLMKSPPDARKTHPHRVAFGLPHNYGPGAANQVGPHGNNLDRRGSPLFLHLHQPDPDIKPVALLLFMPATFLPQHVKIRVGGPKVDVRANLWQPIEAFFERMTNSNQRQEPFTSVTEVTHG